MRYLFGPFELDASQYELRRGGTPLRVEPRVLDLLFYLVRNRDRIVSRQELFDSIWSEKFIGDGALSRCVAEARKAIAVEGQDEPIKTIHRRGYRFVAPVTQQETGPEPAAAAESDAILPDRVAAADPVLHSPVPQTEPAPVPRNRRLTAVGGAAAMAIALVVVITAFSAWRRPAPPSQLPALRVSSDLRITRLTTSGKATDAAVSPDGKFVTYVVDDGGLRSIRVRQVATDIDRELVEGVPGPRKSLAFTPDGNYVVYLEQDAAGAWSIHRVAVLGGVPQRLVESVQDSAWSNRKDASFATDGERVAFIRRLSPGRTALFVRDLRNQAERQILARDGELFRPLWRTGGVDALLCHWKLPGYSTEIRLLDVPLRHGADAREIAASETPLFVAQGALSDQRHLIGVGGRSLGRTTIYLAGFPAMRLTPITQGTAYWQSPSVTPDGRHLVAVRVQENYNLWTAAKGETDQRRVTSDLDAMEGAHGIGVTPAGEFVYTSRTNGEHNHVWLASPDGRHLRQLTSGTEDEYWPVASPVDAAIFYGQRQTTAKKRSMRIWRMDPVTGHSKQLTSGSWDMLPAVTRDGRWVIYSDGAAEVPGIRKVPASGGRAETIASGIMFAPAVSPDGKLLAGFHARTMSDQRTLVTMRLEDGQIIDRFPMTERPGKLCVRWTPAGDGLIVVRERAGVGNLWLYPRSGTARQLTDFSSLGIQAFDILPDGKHFVFSRGKDVSDVVMIADIFERDAEAASR